MYSTGTIVFRHYFHYFNYNNVKKINLPANVIYDCVCSLLSLWYTTTIAQNVDNRKMFKMWATLHTYSMLHEQNGYLLKSNEFVCSQLGMLIPGYLDTWERVAYLGPDRVP